MTGDRSMKTYVITTGALFGVVIVAHVWRVIVEGPRLLTDPFYILVTAIAVALFLWACRLTFRKPSG
jgi:dolichyl-phosphate-mannose--protein O-mannosyl transferase